MRPVSLLAAITVPLLGLQAAWPASVQAQVYDTDQWRVSSVRLCPRADSLFGRLYRSHQTRVRVSYSRPRDTTTIRTLVRTGSWETTSSRLVGTEIAVRIPGRERPADSARIELSFRFLDSLYRSPDQARLDLQVDDSAHIVVEEPQIDYPTGVNARGVALVVTVLLTPEQSLALVRAREVRGTMGPYPFFFYSWELWDINAVYRASLCGVT